MTDVVGTSTWRSDGRAKVTGQATYAGDLSEPGMLYGAILRSPVPSARVLRIDLSRARRMPGVRAAVSAKDAPGELAGWVIRDTPLFAGDVVRYQGEPLAAVAADDLETARAALSEIAVEFEERTVVSTMDQALALDAPRLHPQLAEYAQLPGLDLSPHENVATEWSHETSGVDEAFRTAHRVVEDTFTHDRQYQAYLEPKATLASYRDGRYRIRSGHQYIFNLRDRLAQFLAVRPSDIRVEGQTVGGGFGGKLDFGPEPYAALLSKAAGGRPVQLVFSRAEDLHVTPCREGAIITVRTAVGADGEILGRELFSDHDNGAYCGEMPLMAGLVLLLGGGCYRVPELRARFRLIYTNSPPTGAFRGVSGVAIYNAIEQHTDHIAEELGVDPRDYRLRVLLRDGESLPNGQTLDDVSIARKAFEEVDAVAPWTALRRDKKPLEGIGIATAVWLTNPLPGSATVKFNEDGSVHVVTGACDIGTGAVAQGVVQIVAEELGLDPTEVHLAAPDTDVAGYDGGGQGSRTTRAVGRAAQHAAVQARERLFETAAPLLEADAADLALLDGIVRDTQRPERQVPLTDVLAAAAFGAGAVMGSGRHGEAPVPFDPERARGLAFPALPTPTYHVHLAKVSIDPITGVVRVLRYVVAQEVGRAINPAAVVGQIQGGVAQGIGYALYENLRLDSGQYLEQSLKNYRLPVAADVPEVEMRILEHPDGSGPFGAKGAAEPPMVLVPAAIGNAVADALGVRIPKIPITPEDVLAVLIDRGIDP